MREGKIIVRTPYFKIYRGEKDRIFVGQGLSFFPVDSATRSVVEALEELREAVTTLMVEGGPEAEQRVMELLEVEL